MGRWADVEAAEPGLAAAGASLLTEFTLAYLATVRGDGGPRVHPVTITLFDGDLWVFLVHGTPKRGDLERDPRYALHSFPRLPESTLDSYVDDELVVLGRAEPLDDPDVRRRVAAVHNDTVHERDRLFRLGIERVQHKTRLDGRAVYATWPRAPVAASKVAREPGDP